MATKEAENIIKITKASNTGIVVNLTIAGCEDVYVAKSDKEFGESMWQAFGINGMAPGDISIFTITARKGEEENDNGNAEDKK